jgi:peptide/nickel transport system substrate-binding protein
LVAALVIGGALLGIATAHDRATGAADKVRDGGTFRIVLPAGSIDPAHYDVTSLLLRATCAQLMNFPDRPSPAGLRVVPEVAAGHPRVSPDGRTYTFTIRPGFRFSNGAPVTAASFARAFARALAPSMGSPGGAYMADVVGAKTVRAGEPPAGVSARGNRLVVRLTRPAPDFPARMTMPFFCAVPPNLPLDPEGIGAPLPSAGPYYVAEFVRGQRVVLRRNRFYRGRRPHHVDRFVVELAGGSPLDALARVEAGQADWLYFWSRDQRGQIPRLARRHGINRSRFFLAPGLFNYGYYLNTRRPLFRQNAALRRAVNFAVDRPALRREFGTLTGVLTDQYLPHAIPGFRDARIYPLRGPDVTKARALARGHLRGRRAVLYTPDDTPSVSQAHIIRRNLARIGLDVEIKTWPRDVYLAKLSTRGEPWDLASYGWFADYPDPAQYLNQLFAGTSPPFDPFFDSPRYRRLLAAAAGLRGEEPLPRVRRARRAPGPRRRAVRRPPDLARADARLEPRRPALRRPAPRSRPRGGLPEAMRRVALALAMLAVSGALLGLAAGRGAAGSDVREGGTFRISFAANSLDYVDPALSYSARGWALLDAVCARLMAHPDRPPPEGLRLVPEVAAGYPRVSHDLKTWTFTLRSGFRFSNGAPVRASAFARAINRTLAKGMNSSGAQYTRDIAGAERVLAGETTAAAGVVARGNTLVVRFTRPVPDFAARTTMPFFCAVPPTLPADPEGVGAFPGSGPYYIAEYRAGERVVIRRNRFYRGRRPHHVDRFEVDLRASSFAEVLDRIERGAADWGWASASDHLDPARRVVAKYGLNRSQFFVRPGLSFQAFALNVSRPLFRDNPRLRRAVNFAVDRPAILGARGGALVGSLTDQYLPPGLSAFNDRRIYPLNGPDLRTARSLARGHTRGGKAVLYTFDTPTALAAAQVVRRDLARIGLDVEIKGLPRGGPYARALIAPGEPFDLIFYGFSADFADPYSFLNFQFDGRFIGGTNVPRFDSSSYNRRLRQAARLQGPSRDRAYGRLDVQLARDAAPMIAVYNSNVHTLVSKRVDPRCIVLRPELDLTAVCLKR